MAKHYSIVIARYIIYKVDFLKTIPFDFLYDLTRQICCLALSLVVYCPFSHNSPIFNGISHIIGLLCEYGQYSGQMFFLYPSRDAASSPIIPHSRICLIILTCRQVFSKGFLQLLHLMFLREILQNFFYMNPFRVPSILWGLLEFIQRFILKFLLRFL